MEKENKCTVKKRKFISPQIEIILINKDDIVTCSGIGDGNQGEWDPAPQNFFE